MKVHKASKELYDYIREHAHLDSFSVYDRECIKELVEYDNTVMSVNGACYIVKDLGLGTHFRKIKDITVIRPQE